MTARTWTVLLTTPGTYEFRLFTNGYTRIGTSAPITVTAGTPPVLSVSATTVARGTPVTVTLTNGTVAHTTGWRWRRPGRRIGLYLDYTYVGENVTTKTWTVTMPSTPGTYEFRLFYNGYTRASTSPPITVN